MDFADQVETGQHRISQTPLLTRHTSGLPNALYILSFAPPCPSLFRDPRGFIHHPFVLYGIGTICALIAGVSLPAFDIVTGYWTNGINSSDTSLITSRGSETGWIMTIVGVVTLISFATFITCFPMAGIKLSNLLREEYLAAAIVQDQAFYDRIGPGEVITRASKDIDGIRTGLGERLGYLTWAISTIITALVSAFAHAPRMAAVLLVMIPLTLAIFLFAGYRLDKVTATRDEIDGRAATLIEQGLSSVRIIQSFNLGPQLLSKMEHDMFKPLRSFALKITALKGLQLGVAYGLGFLVYSLGIWYGSISLTHGSVTVGDVITTIYNYTNLFFAFSAIVPHLVATTSAIHSIGKLRTQIERVPPIDVRDSSGICFEHLAGWEPSLDLDHVTFAYPARPTKKALDDVTLSIQPGQFTAFVGPSGSGKSTLAALVLRMYDPITATDISAQDRAILDQVEKTEEDAPNIIPGSGVVRFAGHDVRDLNITSLRRQIAVVQQNPQLVSGTVFDNVAIGLTGTDLDYRGDLDDKSSESQSRLKTMHKRVEEALRKAQAWDFVCELPDGVNTVVSAGRTGVLSGGQVQRVAIARALIRNPRCLLLDEATSAVSADTEIEIQKALLAEQEDRGMTLIAIAHRLSTVVSADKIIVMSAGRVVQSGTYDDLLDPSCPDQTFRSLAFPQAVGSDSRKIIPSSTIHPSTTADMAKAATCQRSDIGIRPLPPAAQSAQTAFLSVKYVFSSAIILGVVGGSIFVVSAWLTGRAIVALSIPDFALMRTAANRWALGFLITALAGFVIVGLHGFGLEYCGNKITSELRRESFRALIRQEIGFFEQKDSGSGTLTAAISQHPGNIETFIGLILAQIISSSSNLIATLIMSFVLNWRLAVMALPALAATTGFGYVNYKCQEAFEAGLTGNMDQQSEFISEAVNTLSVTCALSREAEVIRQFRAKFISKPVSNNWLLRSAVTLGMCQAVMHFFAGLLFWWGAQQVAKGTVQRADVFSVLESVVIAVYISARIFTYTGDFSRMKNSLQIINSWITREPQMSYHSKTTEHPEAKALQGIEFRPKVLALAGVSLRMDSNKAYAFCGTSGAGKSSILAILQRFYDITAGRVLIDGQDIREMQIDHLRGQMGYVSQEPILYSMSIRWNLCSGSLNPEEVTNDQLELACRQACGGQKQRLCIARALIRKPRILLLDEATSALDGDSEAQVQEALDNASRGRITIHIAHRLSTIRKADCIFVMELGLIVESGNHEELVAMKGRYHELVETQL
ncbi:uncharacterized protein IL334_002216 [Kwoniella shivajii]|uniref:ATP-binding cassette, subfamily B (MDR/TAP), member 1 n=1 Tax=Kwoniella shivajii TaxID=564305 RepID=A0ABZ1CU33_9TREE|nr:hypothetical protein IL334_002216 [Kwoniella shivajii]